MLTIAFSNLFGSGGAPLFSIKRGMSDDRAANTIMNTSFTMVCTFAVAFTALCMIFAKPLLIVFGASENALKYALPYLLIYLIGTLPSMISTGMNPFINAQGYSTTGMLSVAIGAVANLVLDPLFPKKVKHIESRQYLCDDRSNSCSFDAKIKSKYKKRV